MVSESFGGTDWQCIERNCDGVLGRIVKGELVLDGAGANTDGVNLVVACPVCGRHKVWWAKDRSVIAAASVLITRMFADLLEIARKDESL